MYEQEVTIRPYQDSDAESIVAIINRDSLHLQNGMHIHEFERFLDEPGARTREHTFVANLHDQIVGYISLCFVETTNGRKVDSFSAVDIPWRRKGIGTILFQFILNHLNAVVSQEDRTIHFVLRVDSRTTGMLELARSHGMEKKHTLLLLRKDDLVHIRNCYVTPNYSFKSPTLQQADAWASIYNDAFQGKKTVESVVYELEGASHSDLNILAFHPGEDEPVAFISSQLVGDRGDIATIAVKQDYQGRGIGHALLIENLLRLKNAGANEITLSVNSANLKAIRLYEKVGFTTYATRSYFFKQISPALEVPLSSK
ncbi:GNAT family N-acetyltransferase [Paenibacillus sp. LMG 31461]|uniref:GNAT family N-acetyltransferase n=1 Tax=Paenibacillus plantarum TaxID=2654975 RepID=A0ABX1XH54_9BACL|nr:GNAT family N-acetyltransferase [Paenibacillus plantarum]NOU67766.1 GNAT family N-acetyltransferase [Paenibacillus plantarum]